MRIAVIGLGKVGLPLAVQFSSKGHTVIGCDVDPRVVSSVNAGLSHVAGEAGLDEAVRRAVTAGDLSATLDVATAVAASEAVVVIVPLMLAPDSSLDFTQLDAATQSIAAALRPGSLVVFETTVPVGTTAGRLRQLLEEGSGLTAGENFYLAFSPERVYSGRIFEDLTRYPKIVGGVDAASQQRAVAFYHAVLDAEVLEVADAETAEFTKLAETSYRDVNIALANQLALYAGSRGVDAKTAFAAANSQPYSHLHRPSIGVGGHCIPVYPRFLLEDAAPSELEMLRVARKINDGMVVTAVQDLREALQGLAGSTVLILGLSYRENVKELAFSAAVPLIRLLRKEGARVLAHDPLFLAEEVDHLGVELADLHQPMQVDAVVIQAFHRQYRSLEWQRFQGLRVVLDGRGGLEPNHLGGTGAVYLAMGTPRRRARDSTRPTLSKP